MNKTRFLAFIWIFLLFLIQNGFDFMLAHSLPPLLVIGIIFYALVEGPLFGLVIGAYAGFFLDLFGIGKIGNEMILFSVLGVLSGLASSKLFRESLLTQLLLPTLGNYFASLMNLVLFKIKIQEAWFDAALLGEAFMPWHLLLTAALSPILFSVLKNVSFVKAERRRAWGPA